jgi:hypothetical protein
VSGVISIYKDAYLAQAVHPSVITDPHRALILEVVGCWCTTRVVHNNRGMATLNNMYWYGVRAAECEDLGLSTPHGGVTNVCAVARILPRANDPRVPCASTIFALDARKELHKGLWVR